MAARARRPKPRPANPPIRNPKPMPTDQKELVGRLRLAGVVTGVAAVAIIGWGVFSRAKAVGDDKVWSDQRSVPVVRTVSPKASAVAENLELPGQLQAYNDAEIYARVS